MSYGDKLMAEDESELLAEMLVLDNSLIFDPRFEVKEVAAVIPPCDNGCEHLSCEVQREDMKQ